MTDWINGETVALGAPPPPEPAALVKVRPMPTSDQVELTITFHTDPPAAVRRPDVWDGRETRRVCVSPDEARALADALHRAADGVDVRRGGP